MSIYVLFAALGLGAGAIYSLLALGLVVTNRASGVVNLAHGSLAMYLAYVFVVLRDEGRLLLPVFVLPHYVNLSDQGVSTAPAVLIVLVYAALLGAAVYWLLFRPLRTAPALARVVASLGLMLALQAVAVLRFGSNPRSATSMFPSGTWSIGDLAVPKDRIYTAGVAVIIALLLWALYRFTRFGAATRAASENERGAMLLGYSPSRLGVINWALATMLAAVAGILIVPITSLDPATYTLFIIPALGAVIVARFSSFTIALLTSFGIAIAQSEMIKLQVTWSWLPKQTSQALPFLVIIVAMAFAGRTFPARDELAPDRMPVAPLPTHLARKALLGLAGGLVGLFVLSGNYRAALIHSLILIVMALSVVIITGYVGQISLAQVTFAGLGGFALSHLAEGHGVPFPLSILLAGFAAVPVGLLIGLPAVRIRGVNLAIVTLGAAFAAEHVIFSNPNFVGLEGSPVPTLKLFGINLDIRGGRIEDYPRAAFGVVVLVVVICTALGVAALRRSSLGGRMLAVRSNESGASALGIDVARTKLIAFALSSFVAALGGGLMGYEQHILSGESFNVFLSLELIAVVYLGGIARISGAVVAGVMLADGGLFGYFLDQRVHFGDYHLLFAGFALMLAALYERDGVATSMTHRFQRLGRLALRLAGRSADPEPGPTTLTIGPVGDQVTLPPPRLQQAGTVFEVRSIDVSYGSVREVDEVSLNVAAGEIVGLIGANGAGKSSVVDAVTGFTPSLRGEVILLGQSIGRLGPHRRAEAGLVRTFQSLHLFEDLSVLENVQVGASLDPERGSGLVAGGGRDAASRVLSALGIADLSARRPDELSNGQRKLVSVARAVASRPVVLILDEPAAGLSSAETAIFADRLRTIASSGTAVLLIDHDMALVMSSCDRVYVMEQGRVLAEGPPAEIRNDPSVVAAYLGSSTRTEALQELS